MLALYQFSSEGVVPLLLMATRRERLSSFGFTARGVGRSVTAGAIFAAINDAARSWRAGAWLWVPLRLHTAVRLSLAAGFPWSVAGIAITILVWGFVEAFFGVFLARRINQMLGHGGQGWVTPGVIGFGLFNGLLHFGIGQGVGGFLESAASGYAIAAIPAIAGNAWGSAVFQTLTNSAGPL